MMTAAKRIPNGDLRDLASGSGYILWALRAALFGVLDCGTLQKAYHRQFGGEAGLVISHVHVVAVVLASEVPRPIRMEIPGSAHITADEATLLTALAAAQDGRTDHMHQALEWLSPGQKGRRLARCLAEIARLFIRHGQKIDAAPPAKPPGRLADRLKPEPLRLAL